jgi:hypothetical protein
MEKFLSFLYEREREGEKEKGETPSASAIFFLVQRGCPGQLARISTNPTSPEVNDHVSLQWPLYEQPQGSNLRPHKEQTS